MNIRLLLLAFLIVAAASGFAAKVANDSEKPYIVKVYGSDVYTGDTCTAVYQEIGVQKLKTLNADAQCMTEGMILHEVDGGALVAGSGIPVSRQFTENFYIRDTKDGPRLIERIAKKETKDPITKVATAIEAGPIWNQKDAQDKCPKICSDKQLKWDGNWWTTVNKKMSVCECAP